MEEWCTEILEKLYLIKSNLESNKIVIKIRKGW